MGIQDPDLTEVPRDSPTRSAQGEGMMLHWVASNKWKLVSGDIKTAFLSVDEEHQNIFILPPDDVRDLLKLSPKFNAETSQSCVWSRERPEEMVGSVETITPESWLHILCVGSLCFCPCQTRTNQRCHWCLCGRLAGRR